MTIRTAVRPMMCLLSTVFWTVLSAHAASYTFVAIDVPGAMNTMAFVVNNTSQIVGRFADSSGSGHGFLLSGGTFTPLDVPDGLNTRASGINDSGTIVGRYTLPGSGGKTVGYKLTGAPSHPANFSTIDVPGSTETRALNISNSDLMVGDYTSGEGRRGFLFDGSTFTAIVDTFPGSTGTRAIGINNAGQIVGDYVDSNGVRRGFLATPVPGVSTRHN